jgi:hypothetical protein
MTIKELPDQVKTGSAVGARGTFHHHSRIILSFGIFGLSPGGLQRSFPHCVRQKERVFLVGVRLFRDAEGKVSPNSYSIEDDMASNHANGERSTCQFCEQTFKVASTWHLSHSCQNFLTKNKVAD